MGLLVDVLLTQLVSTTITLPISLVPLKDLGLTSLTGSRLLQYNNFFRGASSAPLPYASTTTVVFDVQGDWCIRRITCCLCRFAGAYSFEKHTAHLRSRPGDRHPSTRYRAAVPSFPRFYSRTTLHCFHGREASQGVRRFPQLFLAIGEISPRMTSVIGSCERKRARQSSKHSSPRSY